MEKHYLQKQWLESLELIFLVFPVQISTKYLWALDLQGLENYLRKARAQAPCVIFIDEIDGIGSKRGYSFGRENDVTLNKLLVEMDGFKENENILVIGATNREDSLDSALLRSGRFDRKVIIDPPNIKERTAIFSLYLKKMKLANSLDIEEVSQKMAKITPGFTGADIANITNQAAIISVRGNTKDPQMTLNHLEEAIDEVVVGMKKKDRLMTQKNKYSGSSRSRSCINGIPT